MSKSAKQTLQKLIRTDDVQEFIHFLNSHCESGGDDHLLSHYQLLKSICTHGAVSCAHALYDRKDQLYAKLHIPLEGGLSPLHVAAQCLSYDIVEVLLYYKANPNSSCDDDPLNVPLSYALNALCDNKFVREWNPKKSIFKLFFIFCLPELNEPLKIVKLLASKTINREAIALRCVLQGNIVHLAALLLVAWSKLMEPYPYEGIRGSAIGKLIFSEYQQQENNIALIPNSSIVIHERIANLQAQWNVLQILDLALNTIETFRQSGEAEDMLRYEIPFKVASLICHKHLIHMDPEDLLCDDMSCFAPDASLTPKQKAWLDRALDKEIRSFKMPSTSIKTAAGTISGTRSFHTCLARDSYYDKPTRSHQLNTYQARDSKYAELGRSHQLSTCQAQNANYVELAGTQLSRTTHASMRFFPKFLQSQDMAPLVALLKKSIRKL